MSPDWSHLWFIFLQVAGVVAVLAVVVAVIYLLIYRIPRALLRWRDVPATPRPQDGSTADTKGPSSMVRIVPTTLGGILIGPFAGYFLTYWLYSIGPDDSCMWELGAMGLSLFVGAPVGLVTFGLTGFWFGCLLDKKAKRRLLDEGDSELGA